MGDCYARPLGDCARGMSREHYLSEALSEQIGQEVKIYGLSWQKGNPHNATLAKAWVLCAHHNSMLSALDVEVARFFGALRDYSRRTAANEGGNERTAINGGLLERWFLKAMCGTAAAGVTARDGKPSPIGFDPAVVPAVFGRVDPWPAHYRLGYVWQKDMKAFAGNEVSHRFLTMDDIVRSMVTIFNGVCFEMRTEAMPVQKGEDRVWHWRPAGIHFNGRGMRKTIEFTWPGICESGYVQLGAEIIGYVDPSGSPDRPTGAPPAK